MKYCIHCGSEMPDEAEFCKNCGKEIKVKQVSGKGVTKKPLIIGYSIGIVLVSIVVVSLFATGVFGGKDETVQTSADVKPTTGDISESTENTDKSEEEILIDAGWVAEKYKSIGFYLPAKVQHEEYEDDDRSYYVLPDNYLGGDGNTEICKYKSCHLRDGDDIQEDVTIRDENKNFIIASIYDKLMFDESTRNEIKKKFSTPVRETDDMIIYNIKFYETIEELKLIDAKNENSSSLADTVNAEFIYILIKNTDQYYKINITGAAYVDLWMKDKKKDYGTYIKAGDLFTEERHNAFINTIQFLGNGTE